MKQDEIPDRGVLVCPVCRSAAVHGTLKTREMFLGTREPFTYAVCVACGSLWQPDPPVDLSVYYGGAYYLDGPDATGPGPLASVRARAALALPAPVVWRLSRSWGGVPIPAFLAGLGLRLDSKIGDIGSGRGGLLRALRAIGFRNLWGYDPFGGESLDEPGLHLEVVGIEEAPSDFDLLMFNHSLEHVADPEGVLRAAAARLAPGGHVLVRIPIAGSYAHREYGADWVALDPPRHLFVPTEGGMGLLVQRSGFRTVSVVYDSTGMQLWGSEQYRRDIPLRDPRSAALRDGGLFTAEEIAEFEREATRLNRIGDGDAAGFILAPQAMPARGVPPGEPHGPDA